MLTLQQLGEIIQQKQKHKLEFMFNADHYQINIKFKEQIYIYVILENLSLYTKQQRNLRLLHYVEKNTGVLGYMHSTLAYFKTYDVVVQNYLDKYSSLNHILISIDYILQHADILTDSKY